MAKIFISYRRNDSASNARRIYDWLTMRPNADAVFMDLTGIEPGENFHAAIRREIDSAEVMLVIIGKEWAFAENPDGLQRLDEPHDVVRREIMIGLASSMRVVPVLISGAQMPQAVHLPAALAKLTNLNAFRVNEATFEQDMDRLAEYLRKWTVEHPPTDSVEHPNTDSQEIRSHMLQKKVCMLGAAGVGKTSLVSRYVKSIFSDKYLTTLGVKIDKKTVTIGGQEIDLVLWDLAGEEKNYPIKLHQLKGSSGIFLVTDGRNLSLRTALDLRDRVRNEFGPVPFVLAANKIDLCRESWSWEYTREELDERTERIGLIPFTTSALTGTGVDLAFEYLAGQMLKTDNQVL
jgi:small GTP-binding protein